jgi:hypothetical protein
MHVQWHQAQEHQKQRNEPKKSGDHSDVTSREIY